MALWQRDRDGHPVTPGEPIGHADAGSQYTFIRFAEHLDLEGIRPLIGSIGNAYDNALMESVIDMFKTECIRAMVSGFHAGPTGRTPTSSTRPQAGSTGTTSDATDP